ncbi:MAG: hypothetical protein ABEJ88_05075 [Halobacterium sp.]
MSRAVSTVLDASMAVLLVSAAAVALVAVPHQQSRPPNPDAAARTVLESTATATYAPSNQTASGRVAVLLAHAAVAEHRDESPAFVRAVTDAVESVLARTDARVSVVAVAGDATVRAGPRPPVDASVAAVTHEVDAGNETAAVTVRTWSP